MSETISRLPEPEGPEEASIFARPSFLGDSPLANLVYAELREVFIDAFNALRNNLRESFVDLFSPPVVAAPLPNSGNLVNLTITLDDIQALKAYDGNGDHAEIDFRFDVGGQTWSYYKESIYENGDVIPVNHTFTINNWDPTQNLVIRTSGKEIDPGIQADDPLPVGYTILTSQDFYNHDFQTTARDDHFDLVYDWTLAVTPVASMSASDLVLA